MAPILSDTQSFFILKDAMETNPIENINVEPVSLWVKNKDIVQPTTDISLSKILEPGVYIVDYNREQGLFCKKMNTQSDQLFAFSDNVTVKLAEEIELFWSKSDLYKENNLMHKRGILLTGFPGTGKSSAITLLSDQLIKKGGVIFKINGFRNLDHYIDFVRTGFRKIQPDTPIITILEDLDQYDEVESELLDFLDGKTNINHHVILATSNNTSGIPNTFLRPSRIDLQLEIPLPCAITRREYLKFKGVPDDAIDELVERSINFSLADLKELYICLYLLDYSLEDAYDKIASPAVKKSYMTAPLNKTHLGI